MMQDHEFNENQEMFLERLWCLREKGRNSRDILLGTQDQQNRKELLTRFQESGCVKIDGQQVDFMPKGEESARDIIRRLSSLGVHPGAVINVRQHQPTAILRTGETDIALELALVERIYCRLLT